MAGSRALAVSVLAHAAALGVIAYWFDDARAPREAPPEAPVEIEVIAPPASAPVAREIEVAILDDGPAPRALATTAAASRVPERDPRPASDARDPSPASDARDPSTSRGPDPSASRGPVDPSDPSRPSASRGPSDPSDPSGASGPSGPSDPTSALGMRGRRHDLSLSEDAAARALGPDRPAPERVKPTGKIAPAGREGLIDDAVAKFKVHGDGTVDISDKQDIDIKLRLPLPTPKRILRGVKELGDDIAAWREDPYRDTRAGKMQDLPRHLQATPGGCMSYGDGMCDAVDPDAGKRRAPITERSLSGDGVIIPVVGGKADITSYLYRKFAGDPFASRKLKLLDDTRAERVESGRVFRAKQLAASAEMMANNLASVWAATTDAAARREALFELWDECVEGENEAGAAGARARAMVLGWIGARIPRGSAGAYTDADLARLDARRSSRQHFAPYAP